ncbi:Endonuclease 8 1 (DNA glycosylase/AP lyase Nei 1) (DNA-(apurinic or apyrimidinic site) lyase Nei 1) (Endonuclease VIII 1) [Durusdinium trenchii]|uniref:DNA-(apurinic or apyrimidinic site) lyase n=1 Tax=Durusdinium trenchii TaxID=1381693 RepID=A0ABP0SSR8_9DINO
MVEGHSVHRVCLALNRAAAGKKFRATSPNGRFVQGAKAIDGKTLDKLEAIGKNLFAFFEGDQVVHVHFGMSGKWALFDVAGAPEPTATTRLRLVNEECDLVTHLSAMTVQHGSSALFLEKKRLLGEDPLREDAQPEALWERVRKSKQIIGRLLMDQGFFAGVGNIYRAEILLKAGVHPNQPASQVPREDFDRIWFHAVDLLQRGFATGSILTVDKEEAQRLGRPGMRRYIYNQTKCGRCQGPVSSWDMASRTCYACAKCQPRSGVKDEEGAGRVRVFQSHCARDSLQDRLKTPEKLSVKELREQLQKHDLPLTGKKAVLLERFRAHVAHLNPAEEGPPVEEFSKLKVAELRDRLAKAKLSTHGRKAVLVARLEDWQNSAPGEATPEIKPGTKHIKSVQTALQAAKEKERAGEKRNVEHVAEFDQEQAAAATKASKPVRVKRARRNPH